MAYKNIDKPEAGKIYPNGEGGYYQFTGDLKSPWIKSSERSYKLQNEMSHIPKGKIIPGESNFPLGVARNATEGLTFGWGDELGLGAAALAQKMSPGDKPPISEIYGDMRESYDAQQREFAKEHKKAAGVSQIVGGAAGGITAAKSLLNLPKVAQFSRMNPGWSATGMAAGEGAVAGAGYAPDIASIPEYAGKGALVGGGTAMGLNLGGKLLAPPLSYLMSKARGLFPETVDQGAGRITGKLMHDDMITPESLMGNAKRLHPQATMLDVAPANTQAGVTDIVMRNNPAKDQALTFFKQRNAQSANRLLSSLKRSSDVGDDYFREMAKYQDALENQASKYYKVADPAHVDRGTIEGIIEKISYDISGAQGTSLGRDLKKIVTAMVKKEGDSITPKTNIRELQWVKRELDKRIGESIRNDGGQVASQLMPIKRDLVDAMDSIPEYAKARQIYTDKYALANAEELGKQVLKEDAFDVGQMVDLMSEGEKLAFQSGAVKAIRDTKILNRPFGKNAGRGMATPLIRERLRNVFNSDADFNQFVKALDVEDMFFQTTNRTYGNSLTHTRGQAKEMVDSAYRGSDVSGDSPLETAWNSMRKMFRREVPEDVSARITEVFTKPVSQMSNDEIKFMVDAMKKYKFKFMQPGMVPVAGGSGASSGVMSNDVQRSGR